MIMKTLAKILGILLIAGITVSASGQTTGRQFSKIQVLSDRIEIQVSDGTYHIEVLNDFIVHTSFSLMTKSSAISPLLLL